MEMTTNNVISLFEMTKEQRKFFAEDIVTQIELGFADPLKVHIQIKSVSDLINNLTNTDPKENKNYEVAMKYKSMLLDEAEKSGKTFTMYGADFSIKEAGTKYSFNRCNDEVINNLHANRADLTALISERETFLKSLPIEGIEIRIKDELVRIYPPSKKSTTTVIVSMK